jgi:hypothetical protein
MNHPDDYAYEMHLADREAERLAALEDAPVHMWALLGTLNESLDRLAAETDYSPNSVAASDAALNLNRHLEKVLRHTWFGQLAPSSASAHDWDL